MNIENYVYYIINTLVYLAIAVGMKYLLNIKAAKHFNADEQMNDGNLALAIRRGGVQFGLAIAMIGVMGGQGSPDFMTDLGMTVLYGLIAAGFMLFSLLVTDKLVLPGVDNTKEIGKGNVALSCVEFGTLVMTGILAYASITGDQGGIISSLAYFLAGQVMLVVLVLAYEKVFQAKLNPAKKVAEGNVAAGIYLGGKIIAYGLILQSAITGGDIPETFSSAAIELISTAIAGMILLYIFEYLIDVVIVTSSTVKDILEKNQVVQSIQLSISKISVALILGMAIL